VATDRELLEIEIDTLWLRDDRDRLIRDGGQNARAAPHLVIATTSGGLIVAVGSEVPEPLAVQLRRAAASEAPLADPALAPLPLARCEQLLRDPLGPVEISSGPSYVIPPSIAFAPSSEILRSDGENPTALRDKNPELTWTREEWEQLLDGEFGPWVIAKIEGRVVAVCHCARLTGRGAEAGVWTDPDFRGKGHAAAVTAAWASLLARSGRLLFYSTSATNVSSQRVAARLNLRPIGWLWQISAARIN
jgi:RimJ/RimL family protein N-acetyltransferase